MRKICAAIIDTWEPKVMHSYAIEQVLKLPNVAEVFVFSDCPCEIRDDRIRFVKINQINQSWEYSKMVLNQLHSYFDYSHCLIFQWDGFPISQEKWTDSFLDYDYIGAPWYQDKSRTTGTVGNGGFCLFSKKLFQAVNALNISVSADNQVDDTIICIDNRSALEAAGIKFAPLELAGKFSLEWFFSPNTSFGFHGIFNLPNVIPEDKLIEMIDDINIRLKKNPLALSWIIKGCMALNKTRFLDTYFSNNKNSEHIAALTQIEGGTWLKKYCPSPGIIRNPYI